MDSVKLKEKLTHRIKYNENKHGSLENYMLIIEDLIDASKFITLSKVFPLCKDYSDIEVPKKYDNWQYRCCIELYKLGSSNMGSFTSYSENGLSWSKLSDGLPNDFTNEIVSRVGVPRKEEENV